MLMVVLLALGSAGVADASAELEHFAQNGFVGSGPAEAKAGGRFADVCAVETDADALAHVHLLGRAGVGAAQAHLRAIHEVVDGIAERLVHVAVNVRVKAIILRMDIEGS